MLFSLAITQRISGLTKYTVYFFLASRIKYSKTLVCLQASTAPLPTLEGAPRLGESLCGPKHLYCHPHHFTLPLDSHWIWCLACNCKIPLDNLIQNHSWTPWVCIFNEHNILGPASVNNTDYFRINILIYVINWLGSLPLSFLLCQMTE